MTSLILALTVAFAGEGFFDKGQLAVPFDIRTQSKASLLIEEIQGPGAWKQIANGFLITENGYVLTNYHVANSCVRANKEFFRQKYGSIANLSRQGFYSDSPEGLPCRALRAANDRDQEPRFKLQLIALPPIAEQPPARTGQEANGPYYDFAILKITWDAGEKSPAWFPVKNISGSVAIAETVYMLGYPAETDRAEESEMIRNGKYKDVTTGDYRISVGENLVVNPEYYHQPKKDSYFYTSNDGGPGSSGSVLVNNRGEMVGMILGPGNDASTPSVSGCISKYKYCNGVSLYLRSSVIIQTLTDAFPDLAAILF